MSFSSWVTVHWWPWHILISLTCFILYHGLNIREQPQISKAGKECGEGNEGERISLLCLTLLYLTFLSPPQLGKSEYGGFREYLGVSIPDAGVSLLWVKQLCGRHRTRGHISYLGYPSHVCVTHSCSVQKDRLRSTEEVKGGSDLQELACKNINDTPLQPGGHSFLQPKHVSWDLFDTIWFGFSSVVNELVKLSLEKSGD